LGKKDEISHKKSKKSLGRPSKITLEIQEKICSAMLMGAYIETAAAYASINKQTLYTWMKKGNAQKAGIYRTFLDAIEQAMSKCELRDLEAIDKVATGRPEKQDINGNIISQSMAPNWKAAAWRLERKYPKKWGRREQIHVENDSDGPEEENLNAAVNRALASLKDDRWDD